MRWWRGLDFPRVWLLFNGLALILALLGPVVCAGRMNVRIEPVLTSYLVGIVFMIGALGRKPIVQDIAEQRQGAPLRLTVMTCACSFGSLRGSGLPIS